MGKSVSYQSRFTSLLLGLTAALMLPAPASYASPITFMANLSGANENPANLSAGTGTAIVILDPVANTLHVEVTFSGLTGLTTASHIHCCEATPGANLNVGVATTIPTFAGFPLGVTSGTYNNILDLTAASSYNPGFVTGVFDLTHDIAGAELALINGIENDETYLNIHTSLTVNNVQVGFPGGEIRGLLHAVPEPTAIALFGAGLFGLGALRRRRKAKT
jgi:hypothetical protein